MNKRFVISTSTPLYLAQRDAKTVLSVLRRDSSRVNAAQWALVEEIMSRVYVNPASPKVAVLVSDYVRD